MAPHEPEWITQQTLERCCRLRTGEGSSNCRVVRGDQAVVGGMCRFSVPVSPTQLSLTDMLKLARVLGACQQAIRLAEGMLRDTIALAYDLIGRPQRAWRQYAALCAAFRTRQNQDTTRSGANDFEIKPIAFRRRDGTKRATTKNVVGNQRVIILRAWPGTTR